jgi:hypothetical protein
VSATIRRLPERRFADWLYEAFERESGDEYADVPGNGDVGRLLDSPGGTASARDDLAVELLVEVLEGAQFWRGRSTETGLDGEYGTPLTARICAHVRSGDLHLVPGRRPDAIDGWLLETVEDSAGELVGTFEVVAVADAHWHAVGLHRSGLSREQAIELAARWVGLGRPRWIEEARARLEPQLDQPGVLPSHPRRAGAPVRRPSLEAILPAAEVEWPEGLGPALDAIAARLDRATRDRLVEILERHGDAWGWARDVSEVEADGRLPWRTPASPALRAIQRVLAHDPLRAVLAEVTVRRGAEAALLERVARLPQLRTIRALHLPEEPDAAARAGYAWLLRSAALPNLSSIDITDPALVRPALEAGALAHVERVRIAVPAIAPGALDGIVAVVRAMPAVREIEVSECPPDLTAEWIDRLRETAPPGASRIETWPSGGCRAPREAVRRIWQERADLRAFEFRSGIEGEDFGLDRAEIEALRARAVVNLGFPRDARAKDAVETLGRLAPEVDSAIVANDWDPVLGKFVPAAYVRRRASAGVAATRADGARPADEARFGPAASWFLPLSEQEAFRIFADRSVDEGTLGRGLSVEEPIAASVSPALGAELLREVARRHGFYRSVHAIGSRVRAHGRTGPLFEVETTDEDRYGHRARFGAEVLAWILATEGAPPGSDEFDVIGFTPYRVRRGTPGGRAETGLRRIDAIELAASWLGLAQAAKVERWREVLGRQLDATGAQPQAGDDAASARSAVGSSPGLADAAPRSIQRLLAHEPRAALTSVTLRAGADLVELEGVLALPQLAAVRAVHLPQRWDPDTLRTYLTILRSRWLPNLRAVDVVDPAALLSDLERGVLAELERVRIRADAPGVRCAELGELARLMPALRELEIVACDPARLPEWLEWFESDAPLGVLRLELRPARPCAAPWDSIRGVWSRRAALGTLEFQSGFGGDAFRIDRVGVEFPMDKRQRSVAALADDLAPAAPDAGRSRWLADLRAWDAIAPAQRDDPAQWPPCPR